LTLTPNYVAQRQTISPYLFVGRGYGINKDFENNHVKNTIWCRFRISSDVLGVKNLW
jgi:hypothetical protein